MDLNIQHYFYTALVLLFSLSVSGQNTISGRVITNEGPLEFVSINLDDKSVTQTDIDGLFTFENVANGQHEIEISFIGYKTKTLAIDLYKNENLEIMLEADIMLFDEIVVTGTKTFKRKTKSAVIVNVIDSKTLDNIQACNLSEGLKFQPGLRVETDCQTCNYTQLRMNGLAGGYSQILINGRPIFSPLTGL